MAVPECPCQMELSCNYSFPQHQSNHTSDTGDSQKSRRLENPIRVRSAMLFWSCLHYEVPWLHMQPAEGQYIFATDNTIDERGEATMITITDEIKDVTVAEAYSYGLACVGSRSGS